MTNTAKQLWVKNARKVKAFDDVTDKNPITIKLSFTEPIISKQKERST